MGIISLTQNINSKVANSDNSFNGFKNGLSYCDDNQ